MDERHVAASVFEHMATSLEDRHNEWYVCDETDSEVACEATVYSLGGNRFHMNIDGETFVFAVTKEG